MKTKLTLRVSEKVIERAKIYADKNKISLSKMVETYLDTLTKEVKNKDETSITPLVKSLSGVIDLPANFDFKKEYGDYLTEKYK